MWVKDIFNGKFLTKLDGMPELSKLKTWRTQLNKSEVKGQNLFQSNLDSAIYILTYNKPKFKIWGPNHYLS